MSAEERARRADSATVWMLERTSIRDPRDYILECARCGLPFWADYRNAHNARYCSANCCVRDWQDLHAEQVRAEQAAYRARQRARRAA